MKYALSLILLASAMLSGCNSMPPRPMEHSTDFGPVFPVAPPAARAATGGIYTSQQSDSWFGRGRNFQIGDIITVLLDEETTASRTSSAKLNHSASNNVIPMSGFLKNGLFKGGNLTSPSVTSDGGGGIDQNGVIKGSLAVSVTSILGKGKLVLRGEKLLGLTEGSEVIQVAGIIRPEDVAPNNTVQSKRLANAQIIYRGTGDLATASKAGWGTSALLKILPF